MPMPREQEKQPGRVMPAGAVSAGSRKQAARAARTVVKKREKKSDLPCVAAACKEVRSKHGNKPEESIVHKEDSNGSSRRSRYREQPWLLSFLHSIAFSKVRDAFVIYNFSEDACAFFLPHEWHGRLAIAAAPLWKILGAHCHHHHLCHPQSSSFCCGACRRALG